jgi:hypothetical protein
MSPRGILINLKRSLKLSDDGERLWGLHLFEKKKCLVLMQCLKSQKSFLFNYEHQNLAFSVMVAEDLGLAMSGGTDTKVVLHCLNTGKTIKVLELGIKAIFCFQRLGSVVAISGEQMVVFFDLIKREIMTTSPIKIKGIIICMQLRMKQYSENLNKEEWSLILGGSDAKQLISLSLPELINEKSKDILFNLIPSS